MFEVYDKVVKVNEVEYTLKPLTGRYLPKLISASSKIKAVEGETPVLDEDVMNTFYEVVLETFIKSYPQENKEKLEMFVSQNLMSLIQPVVELNLNAKH